jgi:hypothetical protein
MRQTPSRSVAFRLWPSSQMKTPTEASRPFNRFRSQMEPVSHCLPQMTRHQMLSMLKKGKVIVPGKSEPASRMK